MAVGFRSGGLFGSPYGQRSPVAQPHAYAQAPAEQEKPKGGGTKRIVGIIGDALLGLAGQQGIYGPMMHQRRMQEQQERAWQQRAQIERMGRREDMQWEWQNKPRDLGSPYRTEDNAGNVHEMQADGTFKPIFVDPNDRTYLQDGQLITVPNRVRGAMSMGGGGIPTVSDAASYEALAPGTQFRDPQGNLRTKGGAATPAQPPFGGERFVPPPRLTHGSMTSGRRTPKGNKLVGGVENSAHLTGEAADYWGSDLNALLGEVRALPGTRRAFIHGDGSKRHVHGEGDWDTPYFGRRGTAGLRGR